MIPLARQNGTEETPVTVSSSAEYSKEQFASSVQYQQYRDVIGALLEDGKTYTQEYVDKTIQDFLKGGN